MDFDDRFDLEEFIKHFQDLNLLESNEHALELIKRTTKTTRGGEAFSFKPIHMWIGSSSSARFYCGFDCDIDPTGQDPQNKDAADPSKREIPSSVWIRFNTAGRRFQFRVFCAGQSIPSLRPYEAELPFFDVIRGGVELRAKRDGKHVCAHLTIRTRRPPRATVRLVPVLPGRETIYDRSATEADFFRPKLYASLNEAEAGAISPLGSDQAIVKIGLWSTYKFLFHITIRQYKLLWQCMIRLRLMQLEPDLRASLSMSRPLNIHTCWPEEFSSFDIRYLVEGLVSNGTVKEPELASLSKALRHYPHGWLPILEGLFTARRMNNIAKDVMDISRRIRPARPLPSHFLRVRKCLVTPTRCILLPPQLETSNSMLRAFTDFQDRFLRVQFEDEDGALRIKADILKIDAAVNSQKGIFARLRRGIQFGLHIAGRHYVFLCFGESQVKEQGCWMISETENFTVEKVLGWIGDLSEERNIAKHAARQGLVLSTSRPVDLDDLQIKVEYDISDITVTTSRRTYMFTDGAGRCRQELIDYCSRTLGYRWEGAAPSAMQVRIGGGSKGVLCAVPNDMIEANLIQVRKSMVKFKSRGKTTLNVLKFSSYGIAYLNRQGIVLLEGLGVPFHVLLQLFLDEKARVEGPGQLGEKYVATLTKFPLTRAISSGFTEDPLVQNIIRVLKCRLLSELKWKARIPVEKGAYLMGVADETRTLQAGEVFCQIDSPQGCEVVTGTCIIYRNPCLHPGDVRRVQAVNSPSLSYLKNVVVFSTYGTQDLPSMMGGGDLDGDHYTLLWDERLIIPRESEPMDYTPPPPKIYLGPITINETKEFWLEYIKNDILGMICNAHLALADTYSPSHEECVLLAKLASQAVDYGKTGVPVDRTSYTPSASYPDFMGKEEITYTNTNDEDGSSFSEYLATNAIRTHQSDKVLGHMFRNIDPDPVFEPVKEDLEWVPPFTAQVPECWEEYLEEAAALKIQYDFELNGVLRIYSISEAECVAGVILRSIKRRNNDHRDYSLRETVGSVYDEIFSFFEEQAQAYLKSNPVTGDPENDRRAWAFACYKITYDKSFSHYVDSHFCQSPESLTDDDSHEEEEKGSEYIEQVKHEKYLSFPWLFHEDLLDILE